MSIENFAELKAELTAYMFHPRHEARYVNITQQFEGVASRRLRTKWQERVVNLTLNQPGGACDTPSDYATWRSVLWKGRTPYVELDYVHPAYLQSTWIEQDHGDPKIFTIEHLTFRPRPSPDTTPAIYEFHYYQQIPTITQGLNQAGHEGDPDGSNWLITEWPDVYLNGCLFELFKLQRNLDTAQMYKALRDEIFAEIIKASSLETGATSSKVRGEGAALGSGGEYF